MAISDLQLVVWLGTWLPVPGSTLVTSYGMDRRIGILALLVTVAVALTAIIPDVELAPAVSRSAQCVRNPVSSPHTPHRSPSLQLASAAGTPSAISSFAIHTSIIELTYSLSFAKMPSGLKPFAINNIFKGKRLGAPPPA